MNRNQLEFLMKHLEIKDPIQAVQRFGDLMAEEKVDPGEIEFYLKEVMKRVEAKNEKA